VFAFVLATGTETKSLIGDDTVFLMKRQSVYVKGDANRIADRLKVGSVAGEDCETFKGVAGVPIYHLCPRVGSGYMVLGGNVGEGNR
jgi:hypothetical protein